MKKILLIAAFAALTSTAANAQWNLRYQGDVELGYSIGIGTFNMDRINAHTTHGIRFNEYLFAGIGSGLDVYTNNETQLALPIFVSVKGYLPVAMRLDLFAGIEMGGSIGLSEGLGSGGLFVPQIGIAYKILDDKALTFAFGYTNQRWNVKGMGVNVNTDAITLKVGFQF